MDRHRTLSRGQSLLLAAALPVLLLMALGLALTAATGVQAQGGNVIYVEHNAPGPHDGTSWTRAYTNPQQALEAATSGDEIWVARGVYTPTKRTNPADARTAAVQLKQGVALYGGFAGTETQRNERDWTANVTVLSGDLDGDDITDADKVVTTTANIKGVNALHVVTATNVTTSTVLDGFVVTAGKALGGHGGGMLNDHASPTLRYLTFRGNHADGEGGAMRNDTASPVLQDATFTGNCAGLHGGAMYNSNGSNAILTGVVFSDNRAGLRGGAMINDGSNPALVNVTLTRNSASWMGGAMYNTGSSPTLSDVVFSSNDCHGDPANWYSAGHGGGMFNYQNSHPVLTNVVFSSNSATSTGGGMSSAASLNNSVTLYNVTFTENQAVRGGGMWDAAGTVSDGSASTLTDVVFEGNQATDGGGMGFESGRTTLINVELRGNRATGGGGGLYLEQSNKVRVVNATIAGNRADGRGGGVFIHAALPEMVNSIVWGNDAPTGPQYFHETSSVPPYVTHSDMQGWSYGGAGNMNSDPLFVAPIAASAAPTTSGNYRLRSGSPVMDSGDNAAVTVATDLDGNPRIIGLAVDMGAYEIQRLSLYLPVVTR